MGNLYITGDTHGIGNLGKIFYTGIAEEMNTDDFLIVTGDFGLIWREKPDVLEQTLIDMYDQIPCPVLFVDGNHENHERLNGFPVEDWNGGSVHRISSNILHLMRGQVYEITGKRIFTMGGAASTDKGCRVPGVSWWKDEIPAQKERKAAEKVLASAGWRVDIVITHTAPSSVIKEIGADHRIDEYTEWLDKIAGKIDFSRWYFGHFHKDAVFRGGKFVLCYEEINIV